MVEKDKEIKENKEKIESLKKDRVERDREIESNISSNRKNSKKRATQQ